MPHHAISTSASIPTIATKTERSSPSPEKKPMSFFSELPEAKRRKFIHVEDTDRKVRVRVKFNLETVDMAEIPDSYRQKNSVYPRSWLQTEMPESPGAKRARRIRFVEDDDDDVEDGALEGHQRGGSGVAGMGRGMQVGTVTVPARMGEEGGEGMLKVPGLGRRAMEKEDKLNGLGYRMIWRQGRMFAGRKVFLQKSCELAPTSLLTSLSPGGGGPKIMICSG